MMTPPKKYIYGSSFYLIPIYKSSIIQASNENSHINTIILRNTIGDFVIKYRLNMLKPTAVNKQNIDQPPKLTIYIRTVFNNEISSLISLTDFSYTSLETLSFSSIGRQNPCFAIVLNKVPFSGHYGVNSVFMQSIVSFISLGHLSTQMAISCIYEWLVKFN